ncbi:MAG: enoyl-CoA hydratase/isomerase family protein [Novosphingobium sp.]|nr:enoyl-CoA hydratase/isomerase family protein [Novosphingobium sp.]
MLDPRRLWPGETPYDGPLAFIDLDSADPWFRDIALPACPVIGIGDRTHPLATKLDTVIEPPASAAAIERQVLAHPRAAAVAVELLRLLRGVPAEQGLVAESLAYGLLQGSAEHAAWLAQRPRAAPRPDGRVEVRREGDVLTVTLAAPKADNAIDRPMRDVLREAFALAAADLEIRHIRLRGEGRCFSLGAELGEFGTTRDPATAHAIRRLTLPAPMLLRCSDRLEAHVQGACVGAGLEMAAFALRLTAAPDAWFQLPELAMGLLPGAGGCVSLSRRIGRQRTALLILSGRRLSARRALDWWLVNAIVDEPPGDDRGADVDG